MNRQVGVLLALGLAPLVLYVAGGLLIGSGAIIKICGVLLAISFPGALIVPALSARFSGPDHEWDITLFAWASFVTSVVVHAFNISLLKLTGIEVSPMATLLMGGLEALFALTRWWSAPLRFCAPRRSEVVAFLLMLLLVGIWSVGNRGALTRDLDRYWYHAVPMEGRYEGVDLAAQAVSFSPGEILLSGNQGDLTLEGATPPGPDIRYAFLLNGPVGAELKVSCQDGTHVARIERDVLEQPEEGAVARYNQRGTTALFFDGNFESVPCAWSVSGGDEQAKVYHFSGRPDWTFWDSEHNHNLILTHYYQLLNIVENIRWAEETLNGRWLTIHQPPLWSYVYSAVVLYGGTSLLCLHVFFCVLLLALAAVSFRCILFIEPRTHWLLSVPVTLLALSHGKIILLSCSANFPDNLYALSVGVLILGLAGGSLSTFLSAAFFASFLRYPGSTVVILLVFSLLVFDSGRRQLALVALKRFAWVLFIPCAVLAVGAAVSGLLQQWLEILWFETFPEHFHGDYSWASLSSRPKEFYFLWAQYSGFALLFFPFVRGKLPRACALLAVVYSFFLCFIDHFPSHYFLPLLMLTGIVVVGGVGKYRGPMRWGIAGLSTLGLAYWVLLGEM